MLRRVCGSTSSGVYISRAARPHILGSEIWGNGKNGVEIARDGDPYLSGNTIRNHGGVGAPGRGVFVRRTSFGFARILPDNIFLQNEGGDVVREPAEGWGGWEPAFLD